MTEPTFRRRADLPATDDSQVYTSTWLDMLAAAQAEGCAFFRMTVVCNEHPNTEVGDGFYLEGWTSRPDEQPPFTWPADA